MAEQQQEIVAGDRVFLNSGGQPMTVIDVGKFTGTVYCAWKTDAGEDRESRFPVQALTKAAKIAASGLDRP